MMRFFNRCLLALLLANASVMAIAAGEWKDKEFSHFSNGESLRSLLNSFSVTAGVPVEVSDQVIGTISGHFKPMPALQFINSVSNMNALAWYDDGKRIFVYSAAELQQRRFRADSSLRQGLISSLRSIDAYDSQYPLDYLPASQEIIISAPPRYLDLVSETIAALKINDYEKVFADDVKTIRVFEIKHALAADRVSNYRGQNIVVKGVATLLQEIMSDKIGQNLTSELGADEETRAKIDNVKASFASTRVVANQRLNTVIVSDFKSKMPLYEMLVETLDKPMAQVEIEVSIIDVSTNRLDELGVDWGVRTGNGEFGFGSRDALSGAGLGDISLVSGDGVNLSNSLTSNADAFLSKIRFLTTEGDAKVLSQPSILTFDNLEAVIDNSTTFYVKLSGEREVELFPVTSGLVLRVIPHVIYEQDATKIHLSLDIEDGTPTDNTVDSIPTITSSIINTQAMVYEGHSLIVGGYYFDSVSQSEARVPVLGYIPFLGRLFRRTVKDVKSMSRLFLITPTVKKESDLYSNVKENLINRAVNLENIDKK